jgi:hypothetical protein
MMEKVHDNMNDKQHTAAVMSAIEFARLGDGQIAYVKQVDSDQARNLFPALTGLPEGIDLYAVVGADGTPLGLTDSRSSAIASVFEYELEPVSVH